MNIHNLLDGWHLILFSTKLVLVETKSLILSRSQNFWKLTFPSMVPRGRGLGIAGEKKKKKKIIYPGFGIWRGGTEVKHGTKRILVALIAKSTEEPEHESCAHSSAIDSESWNSSSAAMTSDLIELELGHVFGYWLSDFFLCILPISPVDFSNSPNISVFKPVFIQLTHFILQPRALAHKGGKKERQEKDAEQSEQRRWELESWVLVT